MTTRWEVYQLAKDKYNFRLTPAFLKDAARLRRGEPLAYVIGWMPFLNCKIDLSYKPLIPRPETEFWTEKFIALIRANGGIRNKRLGCLDLFAGSGCVGVAVLKNLPGIHVDFADNSRSAIKQIRKNLRLNRINPHRAKIIHSNILQNIGMKYDYILANPPYIPSARKLPSSVRAYEPRAALFGKKDGLYFIQRFLKNAHAHLRPRGQIWMEFDAAQKNRLGKLLKSYGYKKYAFHEDQFNRWRFVVIKMGSN